MFLPVRASASVLVAVSVRPTASSSSRYGSQPASEGIAEPRIFSSRRRSNSIVSVPLFASPVGSAITAPVNRKVLGNHAEVWFARDSPLERGGFELLVPLRRVSLHGGLGWSLMRPCSGTSGGGYGELGARDPSAKTRDRMTRYVG